MTKNLPGLVPLALLVASSTLTACGQKDTTAPLAPAPSSVTAAPAAAATSGPVTGGGQDDSLPDTAAALADSGVASAAKASSPSTMSRDQESKAMPLPGQANDHSTPAPTQPSGRRF